MKYLSTLFIVFFSTCLLGQEHPAFDYIRWGDSFERVQSKVNGDYLPRGYSVVPGSKSKHSQNLSIFPDPVYSTAIYPKYALLFVENGLSGITETVAPEMSRDVLGNYALEEADLFYKQGKVEIYCWKYEDTSLTLEYNPDTGFMRVSWIKNMITKS